MGTFQETLAELFNEKLQYEYIGMQLPLPEIDGSENVINYTKEYEGLGVDIILVECKDRIIEFQKKLIKSEKSLFPNAHFLFVSNEGKVFDLYNNVSSRQLKKITYDTIGRNTRLFREKLQLFDVKNADDGTNLQINAEKAFDASDRITKNFFDKFKKIHDKLQKAITGIESDKDRTWYASVMMNRIMFIYFLQKHYVIQNNTDFLLDKFDEIEKTDKDYYKDFLLPLFFYGFAKRDNNIFKERFVTEYGPVKYLNGGLFYAHHIEKKYTPENVEVAPYGERAIQTNIGIDSKLIKEILKFLDGYTWYLDSRPMKEDTDINPDVLGFIFERYINQKELGAYYTKEDITEYISKNTIIPFVLDKMRRNGFDAPDPSAMITNNENIIGEIGNYVEKIDSYEEVKFLYKDVLLEISILDPSVGSGAFLFSALNVLLPIYQKAVFKLREFAKIETDVWLLEIMETLSKHAEEYFLTKQIILNNLYGVDIVEEATEICKLRLFLQLASHLPDITSIEPLPDIDFNIYAGNSLVGGLNWEDLEANYTMDLFTSANRDFIKADINDLANLKTRYRVIQQKDDNEEELSLLKNNIAVLEHRINTDIKIGIKDPFHWFIDFNDIIEKGGFDVVIGNPPYVTFDEKKAYKLANYTTLKCGDLYAFFIERSNKIINAFSNIGMIIPISIVGTEGYSSLRENIAQNEKISWFANFAMRPGKLFDKVDKRLTIWIGVKGGDFKTPIVYTTKYQRWWSDKREFLFNDLKYIDNKIRFKGIASIPKISFEQEVSILFKLSKHQPIENYFTTTGHKLFHTRKLMNFVQFLDIAPYSIKENGDTSYSSELKEIHFENDLYRDVALGIYNSNLFYWYYIAFSDCRNVNKREVANFPFDFSLVDDNHLTLIAQKSKELMSELHLNSNLETRVYKKIGTLKVLTFSPRLSKGKMDDLDRLIGEIYGLTSEEVDFIVNYDIEFRLGVETEDEE
jgi:hypothetical protein